MSDTIIDAHIHLDKYTPDERSIILDEMEGDNVDALISVSGHLASARKNLQLARHDPRIKPAIGFHPEQPLPTDVEVADLLALIEHHQHEIIAVGEVGMPYYAHLDGNTASRGAYLEILEAFMQKAAELAKPIALHAIYDDAPVVCDLLEIHSVARAHFHWFKGDRWTAERMAANGYFISFTPDILYKEKTRDLATKYPLANIMVETDGPWPFDGIFAGKMTHPNMIHRSVQEISVLKRMPCTDVYKRLYHNTRCFYRL